MDSTVTVAKVGAVLGKQHQCQYLCQYCNGQDKDHTLRMCTHTELGPIHLTA